MEKKLGTTGSPIEPIRIPEGFLFIDLTQTCGFLFFLFFILLWCGISFSQFAIALFQFLAEPSFSSLASVLFLSIFVAIGVIGILSIIKPLIVFLRLKAGEVILPTYPLRMGESCRVRYRRQVRTGSISRPGKITAKWLCYEWVQYGHGTDTETVTHTLWETDLPSRSVSSGTTRIEYDAIVKVLDEGPPSLDKTDNQVRWELQVNLDLPGITKNTKNMSWFQLDLLSLSKGTSKFRFKVSPEVLK